MKSSFPANLTGNIMKSRLWALSLCVALNLHVAAQSNLPPVKLALISESKEASTAANVLTAMLSRNEKVQLLERDEIEKVYREQGLSAANRDYLRLGQILGADGLLVLEAASEGTNQFLKTRLVAVKPGVVIGNTRTVWPVSDLPGWSQWTVNHFDPLFPKLSVLARDAIPISVVNLRSSVGSTESEELERQLTLLTVERLTHERELFVLERRRMDLLSAEKELKGMELSAFWNGSYLLEGVIDRDGYSKETMTLHARLVPPAGGDPREIVLSAKRDNPARLVEQLANRVLEALHRNITPTEWKPADEAAKYFEEARWALRWRMFREAQTASESAWALGKQDLDCALVRVRAYVGDAQPAEIDELYESGNYRDETPGRNVNTFINELISTHPGSVVTRLQGSNAVAYVVFKKFPDAERFSKALRALELFALQLRTLKDAAPAVRKEWGDLGADLLNLGGQWMRDYYLQPKARVGLEVKLESARRVLLEIESALAEIPEADGKRFWSAVGGFGVFWRETPEEGVALYRKLFALRQFDSVRDHVTGCYPVFCDKLLLPVLAAWRTDDLGRIPQLWRRLVEELCASTDKELRVTGFFFVCAETSDIEKFKLAFEQIRREFYFERDMVYDIENMFIDKIQCSCRESQDWEKLRSRVWNFNFALAGAAKDWNPKGGRPIIATNLSIVSVTSPSTNRFPTLPPHLRFPSGTNRLTQATNRAVAGLTKSETQPDNVLDVTRFWKIPLTNQMWITNYSANGEIQGFSGMGAPSSLIAFCYREGCLWVEAEHQWGYVHPRFFFRVNLETFASETIPIDKDLYHPQDNYEFAGSFRTFEVYGGHLYASSSDGIKRYSMARKTWEDLPVPVGGHARITAFGGRIFLSSATAIIEMSPDGQTSKVLASARRRPIKTILDEMDNYYVKVAPDWSSCKLFAPVLPGPGESVMTFVKGRFYSLAQGADDWVPLAQIADGQERERSFDPGGLLVFCSETAMVPPPASELYLTRAGSTNADCIFADKPSQSEQAYLTRMGIRRQHLPPRWVLPDGMRIADSAACLDGDTVWVLHVRPGNRDLTLLHFLPARANPVSYRLRLKRSKGETVLADGHLPNRWIQLEATPRGLTIGGAGVNGFWFIPAAELQRNDELEMSNSQR